MGARERSPFVFFFSQSIVFLFVIHYFSYAVLIEGGNEAIEKLPDSKRIEGGRGALRTELASYRC
jgi:IS1 family transposase